MELKVKNGTATVVRTAKDKYIGSESAFWHALKALLRSSGEDVIKKLMSKDGHMVSDGIYYVRSRNMTRTGAFAIWDDQYAVRNVAKDFNSGKPVTLKFKRSPK